jgi:hypothetical protein
MFEGVKGLAGLAGIMKDLPRIKEKMEQVKAQLGELQVEAETGGGAVRAVASGHMRLVSLEVEPALLSSLVDVTAEEDQVMARELIVGAVNAAFTKAQEAAHQHIAEAAEDAGLPVPPDAFRGLLG